MTRGFDTAEFRDRLARAQEAMARQRLGALLVTTEADIRWITGFLTRFWESPTRPWYVVIPAQGDPVAVIPAIGAPLMARGWLCDIRTWAAPDYRDDGVSLLADTLREVAPDGPIGTPFGLESHLRMPLADFARLQDAMAPAQIGTDHGIIATLRAVKSEAEITKIRAACSVADRAFARVSEIAAPGTPLAQVFRRFQMLCLEEGADWVGYLAGGARQGGYEDVISPATNLPLAPGDVLMLDTGVVLDGYYCDFDRNWAIGRVTPATQSAYHQLLEASDAAFAVAAPGVTAADLHGLMADILGVGPEAGRLGHGLGLQLTEGLSLIPDDHTELRPGMVLTLEPGLPTGEGRMMVHEENIVITETGAAYLSTPAPREIEVLG
ncbi:MAG: aminopeptidase P family protein [Rhodobacteraceae bacterium]|nr:aminopeptidase P family protein [Paracoccaceae bacterium]